MIDRYGIKSPPADKDKFMFQWEVSENNEYAKFYATHQNLRSGKKFNDASRLNIKNLAKSTLTLLDKNMVNFKTYSDLSIPIKSNMKSTDGTPIIFN